MLRYLLFLPLLGVLATAQAESLTITPKHARFEPAVVSSTVQQTYRIENTSTHAVAIKSWKAISGAGQIRNLPDSLAAGEARNIEVDVPLERGPGTQGFRFALFTDEADVERYRFTLSGFAFSLISPENPSLNFGNRAVAPGTRQDIELSARESTPLKLTRVLSKPDWIDVEIDGTTLRARTRATTTLGIQAGTVRVATNLKEQPWVDIPVRAILSGALTPSVYAVGFKPVEVGQRIHADIDITYSGSRKFSDLVANSPEGWTLRRSPCADAKPGTSACMHFAFERTLGEPGRSTGEFVFEMPGEARLAIPFGTMALDKDQKVRELLVDEEGSKANREPFDLRQAIQSDTSTPADASSAPPAAAPAANVARAKGAGPVHIQWRASNEAKVFGYMVYRATDRAGPFVRVTPRPIPRLGDGTATGTQAYRFTDADVSVGTTYFYYVDSVSSTGTTSRLSPVMSKTVTAADTAN